MTGTVQPTSDLLSRLGALAPAVRLEALCATGQTEQQLVELAESCERVAFADVNRALDASAWIVELADAAGGAAARVRARRARSQACAYAGRLDESLAACDEAVEIAERAELPVEVARARAAMLHPLGLQARYADALRVGELAREAFVAAGEVALAGRADINLGVIEQRAGNPVSALLHLDRARQDLAGDPLMLGFIENNRGEALLGLHDFDGATAAFRVSLEASQKAQASMAAAIAEGNLADLAARRGDLSEALLHFERARRRMEADAAESQLARLLAEQAEALELLGMTEEALQSYGDAIPRLEKLGLAYELARARGGRGRALARQHAGHDAEQELAAAATAFATLGHQAATARVNILRARVAQQRGSSAVAAELLDQAEPAIGARSADRVLLLKQRAELEAGRGDLPAALKAAEEGLSLTGELGLSPLRAEMHRTRADLQLRAGKVGEALNDFRAAIERIERLRGSLPADRFRAAYFGDQAKVYEEFVAALLESSSDEALAEAFETIERARSRSLLDLVRGGGQGRGGAELGDEPLRERADRLRSQLNALFSQLMRDDGDRRAGPLDARWREAVQAREEELVALEARLDATRRGDDLLANSQGLPAVQRVLGAREALIEFFALGDRLAAFVVTRAGARVVRNLAPSADVADLVESVQFQMARATRPGALDGARAATLLADVRRQLAQLHLAVAEPLREHLGGRTRWYIAPHGPLHGAPLHALWDGTCYACEAAEFVYTPSASLLVGQTESEKANLKGGAGGLVVGVSDELAPQIEREAREIAQRCLPGSILLLGGAATIGEVRRRAGTVDVLHFACHGWYSSRHPLSSGLKLADGWLTVRDICDLRLRARLVTLSGCETGRTQVTTGNELFGLLRGFLAAGARSILASLWLAGDRVTAELMPRFYDLWLGSGSVGGAAAALRQAQLEILRRRPHPADWAPFILVGKP